MFIDCECTSTGTDSEYMPLHGIWITPYKYVTKAHPVNCGLRPVI